MRSHVALSVGPSVEGVHIPLTPPTSITLPASPQVFTNTSEFKDSLDFFLLLLPSSLAASGFW